MYFDIYNNELFNHTMVLNKIFIQILVKYVFLFWLIYLLL